MDNKTKAKILSSEKMYTMRSKVTKLLRHVISKQISTGFSNEVLLVIINRINDDKALYTNEIDIVLNIAGQIKPVPTSRLKLLLWSLMNEQQHYNDFGQRLK